MGTKLNITRPLAITMWDFSWLERRWPGAGYEDWDEALDGLRERGYDAVRIDAYPHLAAANGGKTWELLPEWNVQDWGSPARIKVRVLPELLEFIGKCAARGMKVGLSTWFREDTDNTRMKIATANDHAEIWLRTLREVGAAGLLDSVLYVDLCNEWPLGCWAPFFKPHDGGSGGVSAVAADLFVVAGPGVCQGGLGVSGFVGPAYLDGAVRGVLSEGGVQL